MPEESQQQQLNFAVIDGSAGYRAVLSAFLLAQWPTACVEEVDPFAETLQGAGLTFGAHSDVILLGGIGTFAEACASLKRLVARDGCPPVILMVSPELEAQAGMLVTAGAASVLFKDAFSRRSLVETIVGLLGDRAGKSANNTLDVAAAVLHASAQRFGQFSFIANGQLNTLAIEHFRFVATLASSNLAQVFSAESVADRRRVIVKVALSTPIHTADARLFCERYRFFASLNGRNVVRYVDAGVADSWPYVVLEYLSGGDLRRRMAAGITPREAVQVLFDLAGALTVVHSGNFAHMDVKPENIFFRGDEMVLIDFNISTRFGHVARNRITGDVLGSPFYMSPEQGQGLTVDGRSDLYSAGVIFYEMLTGAQPYVGESAIQVIFKHIHDEIPLLPRRVRALQPVLDALMAKDREERVKSAAELASLLQPFLLAGDDTDDAQYADTSAVDGAVTGVVGIIPE
ncbi:MAG: serine/threonine protein kinase [Burkholderiales bacterium]|nr:serine/threonine protein kinase [Burkholderiales bacterium]